MKLITLNIWAGNITTPLLEFISNHKEVDIFCFQEVLNGKSEKSHKVVIKNARKIVGNIYSKIEEILPEHNGFFARTQDEAGLAIFVNKNINVEKHGDFFVHRWIDAAVNNGPLTFGRNAQFIQFKKNKKNFTVCNFHGLWTGGNKQDTPERIIQSEKLKEFLNKTDTSNILAGDFNLSPNTKSLLILEDGMRDLVKESGAKTTRSSLYDRFWDGKDKFADYILISKQVKAVDFKVLQDEVSDHLPLYLEFE